MRPPLTTTRDDKDMRWQCSACGAKRGLEVIRTEHDEDNYPIRIRRCKNCKTPFATEEKPFPLDMFYARANSHSARSKKALHRTIQTCKKCHQPYRYGTYSRHVEDPQHVATLVTKPTPATRKLERQRRYRDYWAARGIDITTATANHALRDILMKDLEDIPA